MRHVEQVVELKRKRAGSGEVFQISGAREPLSEDIRGRQRRYAISMAIRTVCVILAVVLWHVQTVIAGIALAGGLILPYVAVIVANGGRSNKTPAPPGFVPGPTRNLLEPGADPRTVTGSGGRDEDQHASP